MYECVFNGSHMSVLNTAVCVCAEKHRTTTDVEEQTRGSVLLDRSVVWVHWTPVVGNQWWDVACCDWTPLVHIFILPVGEGGVYLNPCVCVAICPGFVQMIHSELPLKPNMVW